MIIGLVLSGLIATPAINQCLGETPPSFLFSTNGHTVYQLKPAKVKTGGEKAIVSASFDGTVLHHTPQGKLNQKKINNFFPFDLAVADIENDGFDEALVTITGDTLDLYDHDRSPQRSFNREAPLYQVCPVKTNSGEWVILTGGIEEVLFSLTAKGILKLQSR